ncbi:uncharacterized protein BDZ83DRAFT_106343 [Colletotrichum acutatum]|uniref:Uncharacterized protein n=1 Tax=Glomerella acutata TaxID=27357 RepID=A0AAD8X9N1_GLOAC|nr:uncharacterized protein BDZ83DRAFT_106343 [Colletotrichum acutatum]KAK1711963.1 hypothetical protein BDZ83DRAFT_106343 [Colletotrichum acutatum]
MCNIGQKVMRPGVATRAKPDTAPGRTLSPLRLGVLVTGPARFLAEVPGQRLNQRGGAAGQRGPLSVSLPLAFFLVFYLSLGPLVTNFPFAELRLGFPNLPISVLSGLFHLGVCLFQIPNCQSCSQ